MLPRRYNKIRELERYRGLFFLVGLVVALGLVTIIINWKFYEKEPKGVEDITYEISYDDKDVIPITQRQMPKKVSKPQKAPEKIEVVEDVAEVENDFTLFTSETDENEAVSDKEYRQVEGPIDNTVQDVELEPEDEEEALAFAVVESPPVFPGCENIADRAKQAECFQNKVVKYVHQNIEYTEKARRMKLSGRIFVQFVIEKDGAVSHVEVVRGIDPLVDNEAVRAVQSLPAMTPAKQRGQPVRMKFILPVHLVLQE